MTLLGLISLAANSVYCLETGDPRASVFSSPATGGINFYYQVGVLQHLNGIPTKPCIRRETLMSGAFWSLYNYFSRVCSYIFLSYVVCADVFSYDEHACSGNTLYSLGERFLVRFSSHALCAKQTSMGLCLPAFGTRVLLLARISYILSLIARFFPIRMALEFYRRCFGSACAVNS